MIWREKKQHYGILRLENLPRVERLSLLEYILNHHSQDLASGAIVIASSRTTIVETREFSSDQFYFKVRVELPHAYRIQARVRLNSIEECIEYNKKVLRGLNASPREWR